MLFFFLFRFLIIDLYFLVPVVIAQISNPTAELTLPTGIPTKEAKAERENLKPHNPFCGSYLWFHFGLFLQLSNYLFHLFFQSKFLLHFFSLKLLHIRLVLLRIIK